MWRRSVRCHNPIITNTVAECNTIVRQTTIHTAMSHGKPSTGHCKSEASSDSANPNRAICFLPSPPITTLPYLPTSSPPSTFTSKIDQREKDVERSTNLMWRTLKPGKDSNALGSCLAVLFCFSLILCLFHFTHGLFTLQIHICSERVSLCRRQSPPPLLARKRICQLSCETDRFHL